MIMSLGMHGMLINVCSIGSHGMLVLRLLKFVFVSLQSVVSRGIISSLKCLEVGLGFSGLQRLWTTLLVEYCGWQGFLILFLCMCPSLALCPEPVFVTAVLNDVPRRFEQSCLDVVLHDALQCCDLFGPCFVFGFCHGLLGYAYSCAESGGSAFVAPQY